MTVPRWLIPALAIVAAVAVGLTAWLIGDRFAPSSAETVPPQTETLPVAGPIAPGTESEDDDHVLVSPALGFEDVVVPTGDDGVDPRILATIRDLAEADDPGSGPAESHDESGWPGSSADDGSGDPCAPAEGDGAADCPDGLHGTVLALTAPENPFYVLGSTSPARYEDLPGPTRLLHCDPAATLDDQLVIGIGTNAPAEISMRYWPNDDVDAVTVREFSTSAADRAAWHAGLAADGDFSERWARPQHCSVLFDLEPNVAYWAELDATDELGRTAHHGFAFMLREDRTAPPVRVIPLTDNVLFVSAPHLDSQVAAIRAYAAPDATDPNTCDAEGERLPAYTEPFEHRVSDEYNAAHDYLPAYTQRTSAAFSVPEGSMVALCIRWFTEDAPSWSVDAPVRVYTQFLLSPDRIVPIVELTRLGLLRTMGADSIAITVDTREGANCGGWVGPSVQTATVEFDPPSVLCDLGTLWTGARAESGGDLVVRAEVNRGGENFHNGIVLPLARDACRGICDLPEPSEYRMLLPAIEVSAGLCGSSFGACDPPTREAAAGSAVLSVSWAQGSQNGAAEWVLGAATSVAPEYTPPDFPQMDIFQAPQFVEDGDQVRLGFLLRVDRPAGFEVNLHGDCVVSSTEGTYTAYSGVFDDSRLERWIDFGDVCHDTDYWVTVRLETPEGSWVWSPETPGPTFWLSTVRTPPLEVLLTAIGHFRADPGSTGFGYLSRLRVVIDGVTMVDSSPRCFAAGGFDFSAHPATLEVPEFVRVRIEYTIADADGSSSGTSVRCTVPGLDAPTRTGVYNAVVPWSDLVSGRGVTVPPPGPGGPPDVDLVLRGAHP